MPLFRFSLINEILVDTLFGGKISNKHAVYIFFKIICVTIEIEQNSDSYLKYLIY